VRARGCHSGEVGTVLPVQGRPFALASAAVSYRHWRVTGLGVIIVVATEDMDSVKYRPVIERLNAKLR